MFFDDTPSEVFLSNRVLSHFSDFGYDFDDIKSFQYSLRLVVRDGCVQIKTVITYKEIS